MNRNFLKVVILCQNIRVEITRSQEISWYHHIDLKHSKDAKDFSFNFILFCIIVSWSAYADHCVTKQMEANDYFFIEGQVDCQLFIGICHTEEIQL